MNKTRTLFFFSRPLFLLHVPCCSPYLQNLKIIIINSYHSCLHFSQLFIVQFGFGPRPCLEISLMKVTTTFESMVDHFQCLSYFVFVLNVLFLKGSRTWLWDTLTAALQSSWWLFFSLLCERLSHGPAVFVQFILPDIKLSQKATLSVKIQIGEMEKSRKNLPCNY